jgi:phosphate transport system ATP-binding protein
MVGTKVDDIAPSQESGEQTQMRGGATVVPPRIEVAEDRRGADEDFDAVPSQISVRGLDFFYGKEQALFNNEIEIKQNRVTAVIGPSGCGKSTHIRTYNRIFNLYRDQKASGEIMMDGENILSSQTDLLELRRKIGMIFQKPSPFPMTVFDNVAYGLRQHYRMNKAQLTDRVEHALKRSAIWDEVKDKLNQPGNALSGGQQQRLCIARAIAPEPEVLLMDDPVATAKIEDLVMELKSRYTIVLVTHNMQQAARVSDYTGFFFQGRIVEFGPTTQIFSNPAQKQTEEYITGRFG